MKEELGETKLQFMVTPAALEMVKSFRFVMITTNHVSTGLQPFLFLEEAFLEGVMNSKAMYEAMYADGQNAPPLSEFSAMMKAKAGAPKALYQARHQVRRVYILLVVLLGGERGLTKPYE